MIRSLFTAVGYGINIGVMSGGFDVLLNVYQVVAMLGWVVQDDSGDSGCC